MAKKTPDSDLTRRVVARTLLAMAYDREKFKDDREKFKDRVEEFIGGAYLEFYKATLARKNGQHPEWIEHWEKEVRGLLDRSLVDTIKHSIRGFRDKRKAIDEVVVAKKAKDESYRKSAELVIKKDYKLTKLKATLDNKDTSAFWKRVADAVEIGLAGERKG